MMLIRTVFSLGLAVVLLLTNFTTLRSNDIEVPFVAKKPDFGGEACLAMVLRGLGNDVDQDYVFDRTGIDPVLGRGCVTRELVTAAKTVGFRPGQVWYDIKETKDFATLWNTLAGDLQKKQPSIVVLNQKNVERFVLLIGYDSQKDEVLYHDPNRPSGKRQTMDRYQFLKSALLGVERDGKKISQVVAIRCIGQPKGLAKSKEKFTDADYAQHIRKLKTRLPSADFQLVLQKPFVVIGDGTLPQVKRTASGTVQWSVNGIKKLYFKKDPNEILDIWLFKNPTSYKKHNMALFGEKPSTPYGYYSSANGALVMDISTGGGTLVHEIVHPFMESNFEECPSWFNEGLASLYEQSSRRNGRIAGLTNWRLRGLQLTIEDKRLGSFKDLCSTSTREFYDDGAGTNYAQARYLCYYLQEKGKLVEFYHSFVKNAKTDPSGYKTLQKILKTSDMKAFQTDWEKYVMKLRFR